MSTTPGGIGAGAQPLMTPRLFATGFIAGLVIAAACLAFAIVQLFNFQHDVHELLTKEAPTTITNNFEAFAASLSAQEAAITARIGLRSVALSLGVGFLFLGFSLFLLGVQGDSDLTGEAKDYKVTLTRLSPGLVVILCASVVVLVSSTQPLLFDIQYPGEATSQSQLDSTIPQETNPTPDDQLDKPNKTETTGGNT